MLLISDSSPGSPAVALRTGQINIVLFVDYVCAENSSYTTENIMDEVALKMETDFQSIWLQSPKRWNYTSSMFFCCTVFTTVGYGALYPVTPLGKVACVGYAMVGVPLMLLVILDVGDFLALVMTHSYDLQTHCTLEDGTLVYGRNDVVIRRPLDIRHVLHSQAGVRQKSVRLQKNKKIFERILAREKLLSKSPLSRSMSCPELDRQPRSKKPFVIWDFTGLGEDMDKLDVPFLLILLVVLAYVLIIGLILPLWETELDPLDAIYFCFITVTTIGFGDIVPKHPNYFMLTSLFIISGMAIMSMAFKLSQSRIVGLYRNLVVFFSLFLHSVSE
uniref:Potassium channel, subfamily K, member 18 n=1 Tax=Neogobius melanostomus TaxID=47308 RepID=A0A8C6WQ18_9GOBI